MPPPAASNMSQAAGLQAGGRSSGTSTTGASSAGSVFNATPGALHANKSIDNDVDTSVDDGENSNHTGTNVNGTHAEGNRTDNSTAEGAGSDEERDTNATTAAPVNSSSANDTDCDNTTDDKAPSPFHCKTKKDGKFKGKWVDMDKQVVHQQTDNFKLAELKNATTSSIRVTYKENENLRDILRGLSRSFGKKPTDRCAAAPGCEECLSKSNADFECGWCGTKKKCYEMSPSTQGPMYGSCPPGHWHPETCPESCADKTKYGCSVCLTDPHCGWCNEDNTCRDGNMETPIDGSTCSCWRWGNCEQDCMKVAAFECHCNKTAEDQNRTEFEHAHQVEIKRNESIKNGSIPNLKVYRNGTVECKPKDNGTAFDTDEDQIDPDGSDGDMQAKYEDTVDPDSPSAVLSNSSSRNGTQLNGSNASAASSGILYVSTLSGSASANTSAEAAATATPKSTRSEQAYFTCKQSCFNSTCHMPVWRERFPLVTQYTACKHTCLSKPCTDPAGPTACYDRCSATDCKCDEDCKKEKAKLQKDYTAWLYANEVCVLDCRHSCVNAGRLEATLVIENIPYEVWASGANRSAYDAAFRYDAMAALRSNTTGVSTNVSVEWIGAAANGTLVAFTLQAADVDYDDGETLAAAGAKVANSSFTSLRYSSQHAVQARSPLVEPMPPQPIARHTAHNESNATHAAKLA